MAADNKLAVFVCWTVCAYERSSTTAEGGSYMVIFQILKQDVESHVSFFYHIDVFQITSVIGLFYKNIFIER